MLQKDSHPDSHLAPTLIVGTKRDLKLFLSFIKLQSPKNFIESRPFQEKADSDCMSSFCGNRGQNIYIKQKGVGTFSQS